MAATPVKHRFSVIDSNPLALKVRELVEAGLISDYEAALCLVQDDENTGMEYALCYSADRAERVMEARS